MIRDIKEYKEYLKGVEYRMYLQNSAVALTYDFDLKMVEERHQDFLKKIEDEGFVTKLFLEYLKAMRDGK